MEAVIGKFYRHYKNGQLYQVLNFATHTETGEVMVVYQGLYDTEDLGSKPVFVRPREMFEEKVEVNGKEVNRFSEVPK